MQKHDMAVKWNAWDRVTPAKLKGLAQATPLTLLSLFLHWGFAQKFY